MTGDLFERYGASVSRTRKPKVFTSDAQAPMKPTAQEKAQREKSRQLVQYHKSKRADHQALMDGPHRIAYRGLLLILKTLSTTNSNALLKYLRGGWLDKLNASERAIVMSMIDARIIRVRELNGLPPFDDPLPGRPKNLFLLIRDVINEGPQT